MLQKTCCFWLSLVYRLTLKSLATRLVYNKTHLQNISCCLATSESSYLKTHLTIIVVLHTVKVSRCSSLYAIRDLVTSLIVSDTPRALQPLGNVFLRFYQICLSQVVPFVHDSQNESGSWDYCSFTHRHCRRECK